MTATARKIAAAFKQGQSRVIKNTRSDGTTVYHHGNRIAWRKGNDLCMTLAGWGTVTTRDRLNAIAQEFTGERPYHQANWDQYYNGEEISSHDIQVIEGAFS